MAIAKTLDTVLLLALPASGKSEVRKYLANLTSDQCGNDFHMGPTAQLDDFPYVHLMHCLDEALVARGKSRVYFLAPDRPFQDPRHWGTLIELLNEDYADLHAQKQFHPKSAAIHYMDRFDRAAKVVGASQIGALDDETRFAVADRVEKEARALLEEQNESYAQDLKGKTVVIEFARGGAHGSSLPLAEPFGYRYSLGRLSSEILSRSSILYIWVTPEESRRKNQARTNPNDPGSILHHGVPMEVMMNEYGIDDMQWLEEHSSKPGTVTVTRDGKMFMLPIARFDNRVDKTSFIREDKAKWNPEHVNAVHEGLKGALTRLQAERG
ncbi:hypothetical protein WDW37_00560 [Bdellovibrionota bacterium FG-1]